MQQLVILCPVYNDETCFNLFAAQLEELAGTLTDYQLALLVVNDGSSAPLSLVSKLPLTVITLHRNMGHQKAIAIGLSYAHHNLSFDRMVVMDADGEDRPQDLGLLLKASDKNKSAAVAKRASRQNGKGFKGFYLVYKFLFRLLTGQRISFGNFMVLLKPDVTRLVYTSEIWNHLGGAIIKSKMPYSLVSVHRGKRYQGSSKMNFTSLLLHGMGAIGVFIEIIATRLVIFSVVMIALSVIAILIIIGIRLFTNAAIPGWATTAFSSMLIVLLQSCLLSLFTILLYLSSQSQRQFIPANHYKDFVASIQDPRPINSTLH